MAPAIVDVRGMTCAQALAVAARAAKRLTAHEALTILLDAEDVQRDLLVWARDAGWLAEADGNNRLTLRRMR